MSMLLQFSLDHDCEKDNFMVEERVEKISLKPRGKLTSCLYVRKSENTRVFEMENISRIIAIAGRHVNNSDESLIDKPLDEVLNTISGHFFIVSQDTDGVISVASDPIMSIPIYCYSDGKNACYSDRLDWVLLAVKRVWSISWQQMFSFMLNTSYAGQRTLIDEVKLVDFGTIYTINNDLSTNSKRYWSPPFLSEITRGEAGLNDIAENLISMVASAMKGKKKVVVPLTAGVDSRLVLAAALSVDKSKVIAVTHGYGESHHPDVEIAKDLSDVVCIPHEFIRSENRISQVVDNVEKRDDYHSVLGGQGRHNFLYDMMMYDFLSKKGCDLEFKGLAGGLFKAKWHNNKLTGKILPKFVKPYLNLFGGAARQALDGLDEFFMRTCYEDLPDDVPREYNLDWISYAVRFSNRVSPRTFFQNEYFNAINPFYDRAFLDSYLSIPAEKRGDARVHLKLIEILYPDLLSVPYLHSNQYYRWEAGFGVLLNTKEVIEKGYDANFEKAKRSKFGNLIKSIKRRLNINSGQVPVPAAWSEIKHLIRDNLASEIDKIRVTFPDEFVDFDVDTVMKSATFDSRMYRLYSMVRFINDCSSRGVNFK